MPSLTTQGRARARIAGRLAAALVVGSSLVGVGLTITRDRRAAPAAAEAASRVVAGTTTYAVEQGGVPLGFARTTVAPAAGGVVTTDELVTELPIGGKLNRVTARLRAELTTTLAVRAFSLDVESASGPLAVTGRMESDTLLLLAIAAGGQPADTQRVAVRGPLLLPTTVPLVVALRTAPTVGARYALTVFDPLALAARDVGLTVRAESLFVAADGAGAARPLRAWRLVPDSGGGFDGWVDDAGRVVELEQRGGFTLRRAAAGFAASWKTARPAAGGSPPRDTDILESTAIAASAPLRNGRLSRLVVRLTSVSLAGFEVDGGAQLLRGDRLTVTRDRVAAGTAGYALPARGAVAARFGRELAAEPLLQVNAPEIRALAARVAAGSRDPVVVAERLTRWVNDSLAEEITIGVPSATQVLAARRGDCNEHTQLYLALARAAGLPARGAAGLARVGGKFYYHAWPEVYLGRWVAVDPTFGEFPADAGHLRFVSGGIGRQAELLRLIGALRIEVVESR